MSVENKNNIYDKANTYVIIMWKVKVGLDRYNRLKPKYISQGTDTNKLTVLRGIA